MTEYAKFRDRDYEYGFYIYSHYTTILGLESSEGKTWLFDSLAERYNEGIIIIEASYLRRFGKFIKYSKNRRQVCNFC